MITLVNPHKSELVAESIVKTLVKYHPEKFKHLEDFSLPDETIYSRKPRKDCYRGLKLLNEIMNEPIISVHDGNIINMKHPTDDRYLMDFHLHPIFKNLDQKLGEFLADILH